MSATEEDWETELLRKGRAEAEGWRPVAGEELIGTIIDVDFFTGEFGSYPLLTVERKDGSEVAVHCFHSVLKNEISKLRPVAGDKIYICYHGKVEAKRGGAAYESYRVKLKTDREAPAPWSSMQEEAQQAMQMEGIDSQVEATKGPGQNEDEIPFLPTSGPWGY